MAFLTKKETELQAGGHSFVVTAALTDADRWPNFIMVEVEVPYGSGTDTVFQDVSDDPNALLESAAKAIDAYARSQG